MDTTKCPTLSSLKNPNFDNKIKTNPKEDDKSRKSKEEGLDGQGSRDLNCNKDNLPLKVVSNVNKAYLDNCREGGCNDTIE